MKKYAISQKLREEEAIREISEKVAEKVDEEIFNSLLDNQDKNVRR